jgi:hypothetical protein
VEVLLPGGTLFALLLFLYQRRRRGGAGNRVPSLREPIAPLVDGIRGAGSALLQSLDIGFASVRRSGERDGLEPLEMLR